MQLTCPNCGARYRIDASDWPTDPGVTPGPDGEPLTEPVFRPRRARCKVCRSVWAATPEEEVLELDDPLPPDEEHPRLADAAWASVGGWPDPRPLSPPPVAQPDFAPALDRPPPVFTPPGFTPPKDPSAPLYAPPRRPSIHFEAPPVPLPMPDRPTIRTRLPGPGAAGTVESEVPDDFPPVPVPAFADQPGSGPEADNGASWDGGEEDDEFGEYAPPRRTWLRWLLAALIVAAALWAFLVGTGQVDPERFGLPPYDPSAIGLPEVSLPAAGIAAVRLPRVQPPPLTLKAEVVRRELPGDRKVWEIAGTIGNPTDRTHPVPPVELLLLDSAGREAGRWTVRPEAPSVKPGGAVRFETSAIDPPARAVTLRMQLKPAELGRL